jgi:hypothetical protein
MDRMHFDGGCDMLDLSLLTQLLAFENKPVPTRNIQANMALRC